MLFPFSHCPVYTKRRVGVIYHFLYANLPSSVGAAFVVFSTDTSSNKITVNYRAPAPFKIITPFNPSSSAPRTTYVASTVYCLGQISTNFHHKNSTCGPKRFH
jgi:hypothetical protein